MMRNVSPPAPDLASRTAYLEVVRELIARYNWTLLREEELLGRVLDALRLEDWSSDMVQQVTSQYTIALYEACRQTNDLDRREQAYTDLFRYLYRVAYNRWPDLAGDLAQRALVLVCEQIERCQSPATFLMFAFYKLRQIATATTRLRSDLPLDQPVLRNAITEPDTVEFQLIQQECWQVLLEAIKGLPDLQQQTIALKFLAGLSDEEISARLRIRAGTVRVLRHRGVVQLRENRRLRESCIS
jgi:RNA polymerase sigma factor (sigma-70 family)